MKHAYLIIANRNHNQLQKLITLLDDSRNTIYLMIDKKSIHFTRNFHTMFSIINYVKPIPIYWGGYSQIQAELELFKAAAPYHYIYYHLLSGMDLPLTNQDIIHSFFDHHLHYEFITYGNPDVLPTIELRIKYHLFRKYYHDSNVLLRIFRRIYNIFLKITPQYKINKNRIGYASNWVTIDDDLVQLIVQSTEFIYDIFHSGYLVDELFIPTLMNFYPKFLKKVYYPKPMHNKPNEFQGNLRYIDWWDGNPYVWKLKDYPTLVNAYHMGHLFSRKFDAKIDNKIINKIFNNIMGS